MRARALAMASLLTALACSITSGSDGKPVAVSSSPRHGNPTFSGGTAPGPGNAGKFCPLTAPVDCGTFCCPWGDACGKGVCQETVASVICGGVACGKYCYPAGTVCNVDATLCPASLPVRCGTGCLPPGATCTAAGNCGRFAAPPLNGFACPDGNGYCPQNWICTVLSGEQVCIPGTPPVGIGGCAVPCGKNGCCGNASSSMSSAQGACVSGSCVFQTRAPVDKPCPADAPQECGEGMCCAASAACGACGCPPTKPNVCGTSCCPQDQLCGETGCGACDAQYPIACDPDGCCLPDAQCIAGHCSCGPGEIECGDLCCPAGDVCGSGGCWQCPEGKTKWCDGDCCAESETCRMCAGDSHPVCHASETCPSPPPPQCDASQYLATCPNGSTRCCSVHMLCCRDSMNGGAIGCEFSGFCE